MSGDEDKEAELRSLRDLAWLMDNSIPIPFLRMRVGVESLLGLIPLVGDALGAAISGGILLWAARLGVSRVVMLRMGINVAVETVLGAIPFAGDLFDFAWKANTRNVELLAAHVRDPRGAAKAGWIFITGLLLALLGLLVALGWLSFLFLRWVIGRF